MILTRRQMLGMGGGVVAALSHPRWTALAQDVVEIAMAGRADGSQVWFDPIGVRVRPGQTIRWINRDPSNSHTATAYHPANSGRSRRIPDGAHPWNSDYLLPNQSFSVTLVQEGVYDYYCGPHEPSGMVGRIVVGDPARDDWMDRPAGGQGLPEAALRAFPSVEEIIRNGMVPGG